MVFLEGEVDVKEIGTSEPCGEGMQDVVLRPGVFLRFRAAAQDDIDALSAWLAGQGKDLVRSPASYRDRFAAEDLAAHSRMRLRTLLLLWLVGRCLEAVSAGFQRDERVEAFASQLGVSAQAVPLGSLLAPILTALPDVAAAVEKAIVVPLAPIVEGIEKRSAMH